MVRFFGLLALLLATPALAGSMTNWDAKLNGDPATYHVQGLSLTFATSKNKDGDIVPRLTVRAPDLQPFAVDGESGADARATAFAVGPFDVENPGVQILFTSFTGGAHCCFHALVLERVGQRWRVVDLGSWDGLGLGSVPIDLDGDGTPDFVFGDNAFLYAFDSYAGSWAPPKILNVIGGKVVDVSTAPRFRNVFRVDMEKARDYCHKHDNGACAGYVADGARAGVLSTAWAFMLAHYNRYSNWEYPSRCVGASIDGNCKGCELQPRDYPQSLRWFLEDNNYISKRVGN